MNLIIKINLLNKIQYNNYDLLLILFYSFLWRYKNVYAR